MPKPKRKKFAAHRSISAINPSIVPITHLPSGQRFDNKLYHAFFVKNRVALGNELDAQLIQMCREVWEHCVMQYFKGKPIPMIQDFCGFKGNCSDSTNESFENTGVHRFLILMLVSPTNKNQIVDGYDFANTDTHVPERIFNKKYAVERAFITHVASEFGARMNYILVGEDKQPWVDAIVRCKMNFTQNISAQQVN